MRTLGKALLIVLLFYILYSGVRLGLYGYAAYQNVREIADIYGRTGRDNGAGRFLVAAHPHIEDLHRIASAVHGNLRVGMPLFHGASVLPWVGETAGAVPTLMEAGRGLVDVGFGAITLFLQTAQVNPDSGVIALAAQTFDEQTEGFAVLRTRVAAIRADLEQIDTSRLLDFAATPVSQVQATVRLMEAGLQLSPALPGLLGTDGPRTYLLLMQNNHELRPTGGFISAVGSISVANGSLGEIEIEDSYRIASNAFDHPAAPAALQRYMGIELIFVRDANWSPDFPTTAALVQALYTQDMQQPVHGVVALDLHAVQELVNALGPIYLEGAETPITGENFVEQVIQFWEQPLETGDTLESAGLGEWWNQRKDFMPALAEAAIAKLRSGQVNPLAVAQAAVTVLDTGALQVWLAEPGANQTLAELGWAGEIAAPPGRDFLAVVDTNMGYNKVDAVLSRGVDYAVTWENGQAIATADLHYRHPTPVPGHVCDPEPRYGENYADMTERCYFNYVRIYVPRGSELMDVEGLDRDSLELQAQRGPNNTDVFGGYFVMQPGTEHRVRFTYALPSTITPETYALTVRRQSGTNPLPLQLHVAQTAFSTTLEQSYLHWEPTHVAGP